MFLQQASWRRQGGLPSVLHGQLIAVVNHQGLLPGKCLQVLQPHVGLHLVLPRVSVAAHLLPGRDAVVAAAAGVEGLRVELLMRGAGLEGVGGGEVTALGLQVGTHLNTQGQRLGWAHSQ